MQSGPNVSFDAANTLRRLLLALLAFGLVGIGTELVMLEHYEDIWMLLPLGAIALSLAAVGAHVVLGSARTVLALRVVMAALVALGGLGMGLHYQGSLEFQLEMDPTLSGFALFWKILHMKAPPTLAPGAMAQLGLLGLIATYRHPALRRAGSLPTGV
jgi:hypothetical protein